MRQPKVNDHVRLTRDIPNLWLQRGATGVICSQWFVPMVAYEVEFHEDGSENATRALLLNEQLEVEDGLFFDHELLASSAN